jgi:hypothetical protein
MPVDWLDNRIAELEQQFARENAALAPGKVGATREPLEVVLDELRQLRHRIEQRQLQPGDWAVIGALVQELM